MGTGSGGASLATGPDGLPIPDLGGEVKDPHPAPCREQVPRVSQERDGQ